MSINHGTRGGYYAHRRLKDTPCEACRAAINEYVKEYRQRKGLARNLESERIRRRALVILRERYRSEYDELVAELRAEDLF
jgi:cytidine deaminase